MHNNNKLMAIAVITYQTFDDPMQKERKTTIKSLDVSANRLRYWNW